MTILESSDKTLMKYRARLVDEKGRTYLVKPIEIQHPNELQVRFMWSHYNCRQSLTMKSSRVYNPSGVLIVDATLGGMPLCSGDVLKTSYIVSLGF